MNLLLDTHVLLWWLADDPTLGKDARDTIADATNLVLVSAATVWEIVIKKALGKVELPSGFRETLDSQPFTRLDITADHAFQVERLPAIHRDPFDRILIAQCMTEGLVLATRDKNIRRYGIRTIEA